MPVETQAEARDRDAIVQVHTTCMTERIDATNLKCLQYTKIGNEQHSPCEQHQGES